MNKLIAPVLVCIALSGCNHENSNDEYSLQKLQSVDEGEVFSLDLTGVDANARNYSGSVRMVNDPEQELNGVMVTPKRFRLNITDEDLPTVFPLFQDSTLSLSSVYALDENALLLSIHKNTGDVCTNTSPDKLPDFVNPGDAGSLSPLQCLGDVTEYRDWEVSADGEDLAKLTITIIVKDLSDSILTTEVKGFILDKAGNILGFEIETDIGSPTYHSRVNMYSQSLLSR
ncbi:MAG: hypothetical protein P8166_04575 [Candidatus Thiodiazotropha sp.]